MEAFGVARRTQEEVECMNYFYCAECNGVMDEIEATVFIPEIHPELDGCPTEYLTERRCIYCGSPFIEEAAECEKCGEITPVSDLEDGLCPECQE